MLFQHTPIKAGDNSRRNWKKINAQGAALERLAEAHGATVRRLGEATDSRTPQPTLHPFKIYTTPTGLRETPDSSDWRKVRVRAGTVFVDWTELTADGTDGTANPDTTEVGEDNEIIDPAPTAKYWIWIEIVGSRATVEHSATAPTWSSTKIPIGWVDSNTYSSEKKLIIRQFLRTDIFTCS